MAHGLPATADTRIMSFNTLALQTQDEAYTLAYYLLGNERHAERATQVAFEQLHRHARLELNRFRLDVLRRVVNGCRRIGHIMPNRSVLRSTLRMVASQDETIQRLIPLNEGERAVVVLVDILGLSYDEAAQVLDSSKKEVGRILAQARLALSQQEFARQAEPSVLG